MSGMSNETAFRDEELDRVLSLGQIVQQERHHVHKHWHTPIVPPNAAELAIITDLENKLSAQLMSDPNLTEIARDSITTTTNTTANPENVQQQQPTQLSLLIKSANMKMERLKAEREAERERMALQSTKNRLDRAKQVSVKSQEEQFEEDFLSDLFSFSSCCGGVGVARNKRKKVVPVQHLSVYEQQKLEMERQRKTTRRK
ncbi:UNVERIFIED_CONTAM: hypothetical protein HDU68_006318 [Siphonaria sp. JEL0065]|nr:hypothetical protein HDU68_006318 [Siphonaria sp. JEL0065]